jgi:hypothetical protein
MKIKIKIKLLAAICLLTASGYCGQLNPAQCVKAIVGEASSETYKTQVAIAAVIRNRGSLKGVYGIHSPHIKRESKQTFAKAEKAWTESAKFDPTNGCNMWGGKCDDWYFMGVLKLKPVMTIGSTRFYRNDKV